MTTDKTTGAAAPARTGGPAEGPSLAERMLAALDRTLTEVMDQPDLPALQWTSDTIATQLTAGTLQEALEQIHLVGHATADYDESDVPAVLALWAEHLDLAPDQSASPGSLEYQGTFEGHPIVVWGVIDRDLWETDSTPQPAMDLQ
jgi:hypothetical protein